MLTETELDIELLQEQIAELIIKVNKLEVAVYDRGNK